MGFMSLNFKSLEVKFVKGKDNYSFLPLYSVKENRYLWRAIRPTDTYKGPEHTPHPGDLAAGTWDQAGDGTGEG